MRLIARRQTPKRTVEPWRYQVAIVVTNMVLEDKGKDQWLESGWSTGKLRFILVLLVE